MKSSRLFAFFHTVFAMLLGIGFVSGSLALIDHGAQLFTFSVPPLAELALRDAPAPDSGLSVRVDLESKEVIVFEGRTRIASYKIEKLPNPHSPWDVRTGTYVVEAKEEKHVSPISHAVFPYALSLGGNAMITGPLAPDSKASGGIFLSHDDAEAFFKKVPLDTKVTVVGEGPSHAYAARTGGSDEVAYFGETFAKKGVVTSEAYLVGDLDTGEILLEKNKDRILPIASVSKLFSALVADDLLEAEEELPKSKMFGLSYAELLYPMLLESNNAAAEELARLRGWDQFIDAMNVKTSSIGLSSTSFEDPSGLSPNNTSTAGDLFRLAQHIYTDEQDLLEITRTKSYKKTLNTNRLIRANDANYIGGKTGYIPEAGQTFVALFSFPLSEFKKKNIAVIVLRSANRYRDTERITDSLASELYKPGAEGESMLALDPEILDRNAKKNTVVFAGDIMLDRTVRKVVENRCEGDYGCLFEYAGFLKSGDLTFANLEGPISDKGYDLGNLYSFRMDPKVLPVLREAGIDVLSVANNHIGDWGRAAFEDTLDRLVNAEIVPVGAGKDREDAKRVKIVERNGVRFGFLAFSDVGPAWLAKPENLPSVLLANDPDFSKIIADAKKECDLLIVSFHFGEEYEKTENARQRKLARGAIDAGANIVVGHHPHVRQPIEEYKGGLIAYSLGNFIFDQPFSEETKEAGVLEVNFDGTTITNYTEHVAKINSQYQPVFPFEE